MSLNFCALGRPRLQPGAIRFYYTRVLQIPTPRNGLLDSLALQLDTPPKGPSYPRGPVHRRLVSTAIGSIFTVNITPMIAM